ncbi:MAG: NAD-dependent epimerase/dehydratase family protein [Limisphaerales bacterium]
MRLPFHYVQQLEDGLSEPSEPLIESLARVKGDIMVLGVAGKMGPTLARMAKRASEIAGNNNRKVIGVSRFTAPEQQQELQRHGVETIACDLLNPDALQKLPDVPNIVYMAGMKFGSSGNESMTWMMNTVLPAFVCRKFPSSKIVAFSTGNIYGLVPRTKPSVEPDAPHPVGEYAQSCLGRERVFEFYCKQYQIPTAIIRLNYACDLRYGVLVDLAQKIFADQPIDLAMGWFNTIWQGDANAMALRCFEQLDNTPSGTPFVINVTGPEILNVRDVAEKLGERLRKKPSFTGEQSNTALLSDAARALQLFGEPIVSTQELIDWVGDWIVLGGETLNKPTHFESRDGKF